ncbi:protein of unknown function [Shinella sp. WSC3-e]|nr:protein of unknown function [Shinella sp. WSC3-e]
MYYPTSLLAPGELERTSDLVSSQINFWG